MSDWEYWKIDGRSASVKVKAQTGTTKPEIFYFEYYDDARKWCAQHGRYHIEKGIRYRYDLYSRFDRSWFCAEQETNYGKK